MNLEEYKTTMKYIRTLMPDLGKWLKALPKETLDLWFEDVFSFLDVVDVKPAILKLFHEDGLKSFVRDRLPSILSICAQDIAHDRKVRHDRVRLQRETKQRRSIAIEIESSGQYAELIRRQDDYRKEYDVDRTPDDVRHEMIEDIFKDEPNDPAEAGPRYKCLECKDSGFVGVRSDSIFDYVAHCSCENGEKRKEAFSGNHRQLGSALKDGLQGSFGFGK